MTNSNILNGYYEIVNNPRLNRPNETSTVHDKKSGPELLSTVPHRPTNKTTVEDDEKSHPLFHYV